MDLSIRHCRRLIWFCLLSICFLELTHAHLRIQDLGGNDWSAFDANQRSTIIPSKVPGSIYSDLRRTGVLDELYKDFNDIKTRWVSKKNWIFVKNFDADSDLFNHDQIYLVCHGLDTIANVFLNGNLLGSTDNMFVRYKWPVKHLLKPMQNIIQISFTSPVHYAKEQFLKANITIPPVCPPLSQNGECHVNFIRKMQASFSWDWGPAFPTQGIWKPIVLEAYDNIIIRSISVNTIFEHSGQWLLNATIWMESRPKNTVQSNLTLFLSGQRLTFKEFNVQFDSEGESSINIFALVPQNFNIDPWYPNGLGEQNLYRLNATLQTNHETVSKEISIGFRTIELIQDRLNSSVEAYSFYFKVNGLPIFSKGSNWIPAHVLNEDVQKEYLAFLLWSAKEANMNMLRVWGGGIYESDFFYQLADQYGILIWQDMMFACALYPSDEKFISSVRKEIRQQIRRLQHHPSIAVWAGNNENEQALAQFWWTEILTHMENFKQDYLKLYIETIMPIIIQEDISRPYLSSSPSNGIVSPKENFISTHPQDVKYGDVHHYFGFAWEWKSAPSAKFVSEYGFQSLPSLGLLKKYLSMEFLKYPFNEGLIHRQHKSDGNGLLLGQMKIYLPLPPNTNGSLRELDDFIYLSQIFQAMAIKIQTEFYRRNRQVNYKTGEGFTMGALYWQLNNIWPGFSWTSIEYEGKWKMLHYYAKKMFDNLLVDVFKDQNNLQVMIIRDDYSHPTEFNVTVMVYDWSHQDPLYTYITTSKTHPFSVVLAHQEPLDGLLQKAKCQDPNQCFIYVKMSGILNGKLLTRDNFLLVRGNLISARLPRNPRIQLKSISGPLDDRTGSYTYEMVLTTDQIIPFLWIDFAPTSDLFGVFSDNGFFMIKETKIQIRITKNIPKEELISALLVKTFNDIPY